jgi:hypothetical protein
MAVGRWNLFPIQGKWTGGSFPTRSLQDRSISKPETVLNTKVRKKIETEGGQKNEARPLNKTRGGVT